MTHRDDPEVRCEIPVYRVAASCTGCELCETFAHDIFVRIPGTEFYRVARQPETPEEERRCEEALEHCHMHVIRRTVSGVRA